MSYGFWIPPLGPDGSAPQHCTKEDFLETAKQRAVVYFRTRLLSEPMETSMKSAEAAIQAAYLIAQTGIVGDSFRVNITGHANLVPGVSNQNSSNDYCAINIQAVRVTT